MIEIEGASPEQRAILEALLAGLPSTQMGRLRVEPEYDLEPERDEHDNPPADWDPTTPLGDALRLLDPPRPDVRSQWELELVGMAFHRASAKSGLTPVVAASSQNGGPYFWEDTRSEGPTPDRRDVQGRIQAAAAATGALLDRVEFLQPGGLAVAVTLAVPEAHGFLRHGLTAFNQLSSEQGGLAGTYLEVVDGSSEPVYVLACRDFGCMSSSRADVACCAPRGLGRGIMDPGPPPCPFPSRTWEDMYEALRRDLPRTTGKDQEAWRKEAAARGLSTRSDRIRWLQREGLGLAQAYAIAAVDD